MSADIKDVTADHAGYGFSDDELASEPLVYKEDLLKGQVFILSGGGSGIGKATAFVLARLGADVMICGRREDKLAATAASIQTHVGREVAYFPMTIRDPEQVSDLLDATVARFGKFTTLINNGGGQFPQDAIDFSVKGWNAVIDTNLNGTWYMMQQAAQRWREAGTGGHIINVVAVIGRGMPQVAHTCAARAGVIYLSKTVSTEWAPLNIQVNCVAPGSIATTGLNVYEPEVAAMFQYANPMHRFGDSMDIAQAIVYLAAPSGKFVTGEVLTVDGGAQQHGENWSAGIPDYFKVHGR
ncbi:MAG: SDR family oxidoreductase [Pseudomonadota bacterium]